MNRTWLSNWAIIVARLAFAATIVLIPFNLRLVLVSRPVPPIYRDYTDVLLFASDIFLLATLMGWLASLALAPRQVRRGPWFLTFPIAGMIVVGISSAIFSVDPILSLYHSVRLIVLGGLYFFILNEIQSITDLLVPGAIQVMIQSIIGIAQFLQQHSLGLQALGELELDPAWNSVSIVWFGKQIALRAYGLTAHPNILGGCLAFALILLALWHIETSPNRRGVFAILFGVGALALLFTFSRAAWLALGAAILLMFLMFWRARHLQPALALVALMLATLILLVPFAWSNAGYLGVRLNPNEPSMFTGENRAVVEREALNTAANKIFSDHALTGIGLGALPVSLRNTFPDFPFDYQPAHVVLLDAAAETGIFGALFYFMALSAPWIALFANRRRLNFSPALIGVSGLLLAITVVGFFDYYTWLLAPGRLWQWSAWGLWGTIYQSSFVGAQNV